MKILLGNETKFDKDNNNAKDVYLHLHFHSRDVLMRSFNSDTLVNLTLKKSELKELKKAIEDYEHR